MIWNNKCPPDTVPGPERVTQRLEGVDDFFLLHVETLALEGLVTCRGHPSGKQTAEGQSQERSLRHLYPFQHAYHTRSYSLHSLFLVFPLLGLEVSSTYLKIPGYWSMFSFVIFYSVNSRSRLLHEKKTCSMVASEEEWNFGEDRSTIWRLARPDFYSFVILEADAMPFF